MLPFKEREIYGPACKPFQGDHKFYFLKNFLGLCLHQPDHWANSLIIVLEKRMVSPPSAAQLFPPLDHVIFHLLRAPKSLLKMSLSLQVQSLPSKLEWVGDSLHHLDRQ